MKRLSGWTVFCSNKVVDYKLPATPDTKFIVDDSCFCPMSEAVKQLSKVSPLSPEEVASAYDFPDGKDTGKKVPVQRMPYSSDITEISNSIMDDVKEITEKVEKAQEQAKKEAEFNARLNKANNSGIDSSGNSE